MGSSCCKRSKDEDQDRDETQVLVAKKDMDRQHSAASTTHLKDDWKRKNLTKENVKVAIPTIQQEDDEKSSESITTKEYNNRGTSVFDNDPPSTRPPPRTFQDYDRIPAEMDPLTRAVNKLAVDIYFKIDSSQPDQNIVFSPLAIALALAMVEAGASGKTREEIHKLIGPVVATVAKSGDRTGQLREKVLQIFECGKSYGAMQHILNIPETDGELRLGNAIFHDHGSSVNESYKKKVKEWFKTEVVAVPFKKDAEKARQQVNRWVSDKTAGKIPGLLRQSRSRQEMAFMWVNAIFMRMHWELKHHDWWKTEEGTFHSFGRKKKQKIKILSSKYLSSLLFKIHPLFRVLQLPYIGGKMGLYIILPRVRDQIKEIEKHMNADRLINVFKELHRVQELQISMPKFTMRRSISVLSTLGIRNSDELGRMTTDRGATVSEVVHEACIELDEKGLLAHHLHPDCPPPIESIWRSPSYFIANHPFLFFVVHKPTWTIVFMGKMSYVETAVMGQP